MIYGKGLGIFKEESNVYLKEGVDNITEIATSADGFKYKLDKEN